MDVLVAILSVAVVFFVLGLPFAVLIGAVRGIRRGWSGK